MKEELPLQSLECLDEKSYCEAVYRKLLRGGEKREVVVRIDRPDDITGEEYLDYLTSYATRSKVIENGG